MRTICDDCAELDPEVDMLCVDCQNWKDYEELVTNDLIHHKVYWDSRENVDL